MDLGVLVFLTSGLFLGWSLGANNAANVFGTAVGTRMVRFGTAAAVCSVFVLLGAVFSGAGAAHTLVRLGAVNAIAGAFCIALAAALTVYSLVRIGLSVSSGQAVVGAIVGWNLFTHSYTDPYLLGRIVIAWVAGPVLAGIFAVLLYRLTQRLLSRVPLHLLRLDAYTRAALLAAGAFGAYGLGANNIANVMGVFMRVSPFTDLRIGGVATLTSVQQLFALGAVAIAVGVFTYSRRVMSTIGEHLLPMSPVSACVVVVAEATVLLLFSSRTFEHALSSIGLPTIPLVPISSSQAVVGAVIGIGLSRGGQDINWRLLRQIALGWVSAPVLAALICLPTLFIVQNVFNQQVYEPVRYTLSPEVLTQLAARGVRLNPSRATMHTRFASARGLLEALQRVRGYAPGRDRLILYYAEQVDLYVDPARLRGLDARLLSPRERASVAALAGRRFSYKWQLRRALVREDSDWASKHPEAHLRRKLDYLYSVFGPGG